MQEFIHSVVSQLGISEDTAKSATGGLLSLLKEKTGGDAMNSLLAKLPGAEGLMSSVGSGSKGGLGAALGGLGSTFGGQGGGAAGVLAALQGSGLNASQVGPFVKMLVDFAKQKAGPDLVNQALEKAPDLKNLLG